VQQHEDIEDAGLADSPRLVFALAIKPIQGRYRTRVDDGDCSRPRDMEKIVIECRIDIEWPRKSAIRVWRGECRGLSRWREAGDP